MVAKFTIIVPILENKMINKLQSKEGFVLCNYCNSIYLDYLLQLDFLRFYWNG